MTAGSTRSRNVQLVKKKCGRLFAVAAEEFEEGDVGAGCRYHLLRQ